MIEHRCGLVVGSDRIKVNKECAESVTSGAVVILCQGDKE